MKKAVLLLVLLVGLFSVGCGPSMKYSADERARVRKMSWDVQYRAMKDDLDYLLLLDRNTRLSEYHVYIGR